jgi:hypothetical protein
MTTRKQRNAEVEAADAAINAVYDDILQDRDRAERASREGFRPEPGEQFQIMRGYQHDDTVFRVREYAPITSPPELIQASYNLPALPTEIVHAARLERHNTVMVGTSMHTFPTAIMIPVGSTTQAYSAANGGRSKPRAPRKAGSGFCEHCGEPTKGGRFIPGHDAKLKGELQREGTPEAIAEKVIRGWASPADLSAQMAKRVSKLVAQGDGFLRSRIAARTGHDPGGADR